MTQKKKAKNEIITLPVIIEKTSDEKYPYFVKIPDIDGCTQGSSEVEALLMAKDYIGEYVTGHEIESNPNLPMIEEEQKMQRKVMLVQVSVS